MSDPKNAVKYANGPWQVGRRAGRPNGVAIFTDSGPLALQDWIADLADTGDKKRINANGRLIAAAPELLEALKFAKEVIDDQAERFHKDCRCQLCESLPMMIDAAIAKAEATHEG